MPKLRAARSDAVSLYDRLGDRRRLGREGGACNASRDACHILSRKNFMPMVTKDGCRRASADAWDGGELSLHLVARSHSYTASLARL